MNSENEKNTDKNGRNLKPRCINIDCAFNSSLNPADKRNICNHPNVFVDQASLEITIAICSEFMSKKDYKFEKPNTVIDLKDNSVTHLNINDRDEAKAITVEPADKENTEDNESIIKEVSIPIVSSLAEENIEREKPNIIDTGEENYNIPKLTDSPNWNLQILKRLYQPYLKRGIILSVLIHLLIIGFLYLFLSSEDTNDELTQDKRIVVVEDIETPKFEPPDMDVKEEPPASEQEVKDNTVNVRPQITPKNIKPRIDRPDNTNENKDTTNTASNDSTFKRSGLNDSLLAKYLSDTNRYNIPDSLRRTFGENEIGLNIIYPAGWTIRDSRFFNPDEKEFSGVILNTDTSSEDPGAVQLTIIIDDDQRYFSKIKFKNTFDLLDTLSTAYSAEPERFDARKEISYKFYIFAPTNKIYVDANIKESFFEKYKPIVEAIVRSIKIAKNPSASNP